MAIGSWPEPFPIRSPVLRSAGAGTARRTTRGCAPRSTMPGYAATKPSIMSSTIRSCCVDQLLHWFTLAIRRIFGEDFRHRARTGVADARHRRSRRSGRDRAAPSCPLGRSGPLPSGIGRRLRRVVTGGAARGFRGGDQRIQHRLVAPLRHAELRDLRRRVRQAPSADPARPAIAVSSPPMSAPNRAPDVPPAAPLNACAAAPGSAADDRFESPCAWPRRGPRLRWPRPARSTAAPAPRSAARDPAKNASLIQRCPA